MNIAIVSDDPTALELLKQTVLSVPEYQVLWVAGSSEQAVNFALSDLPDLILMGIDMSSLDGVETTRIIMQQSPCAILIVTSSIDEYSGKIFDALGVGALDVVNIPNIAGDTDIKGFKSLLDKMVSINLLIAPSAKHRERVKKQTIIPSKSKKNILLIGASTGGPNALATILSEFPANFPVPIVIVQHVDAQFVSGLCDWLNKQTVLTVKLTEQGCRLSAGCVYLSNAGKHITINMFEAVQYQAEPLDSIHRPSIDILFESISHNWSGEAMGVLLTGMGKDGAAGLLAMREHGFSTLTQDAQSCAVYGMPKAAVELNAAQVVLPLNEIATALCQHFNVNVKPQVMIHE